MRSKSKSKQALFIIIMSIAVGAVIFAVMAALGRLPSYLNMEFLQGDASISKKLDIPFYFITLVVYGAVLTVFVYFKGWRKIGDFFKRIGAYIKDQCTNYKKRTIIRVVTFIACFVCGFVADYVIEHSRGGTSLGTNFCWYRFVLFTAVCLFVWGLVMFRETICDKPERGFVLLCLITGVCMTFSYVGNVSWDDEIHYKRALNFSTISYNEISRADEITMDKGYNYPPLEFDMSKINDNIAYMDKMAAEGKTVQTDRIFDEYFNRIAYVPSALALFIGRGIGLPFHISFWLGKLFNLLAYCIIMYFAIKRLKSGKLLLTALALMPTCVFMASNYNYDYWVTGFTALAFSYIFYHVQSPEVKMTGKDIAIIYVSFYLGIIPKAVYFPIVLIGLIIGKDKFKTAKASKWYRIGLVGVMAFLVLSFVVPMFFAGPVNDVRGGLGVNSSKQIAWILSHPIDFAKVFLRYMKGYLSVASVPDYTALFDPAGEGPFGYLYFALVFALAFIDKKEVDSFTMTPRNRIWTALMCFGAASLVALSLYIMFTPIHYYTVKGCQPRYLIPLLFPVYYLMGSAKGTKYFTRMSHYMIVYFSIGYMLLRTIYTLASKRYF